MRLVRGPAYCWNRCRARRWPRAAPGAGAATSCCAAPGPATAPACCSSPMGAWCSFCPSPTTTCWSAPPTPTIAVTRRCSVLPAEVTYLCDAANRYLRDPIAAEEVAWRFAGVRPLLADPDPRAARLSRDYRLQLQSHPAPALHVLGGKLTTYRVLAEEALELLRPALPQMGPAWTAGGPAAWQRLGRRHAGVLAPAVAGTVVARGNGTPLGRRLRQPQRGAAAWPAGCERSWRRLWRRLHARKSLSCVSTNGASNAEDVLWRRSKLGLRLDAAQVARLQAWMEQAGSAGS